MIRDKTTFALFFGNRSFFPASLQSSARKQLKAALKKLGHKTITLALQATRHGAVETPEEGAIYAEFLRKNRGRFGGVILCLPNFGDETGAVAALKDADVPILIQAYPDDLDKMAPAQRRDAFCGKLSIADVFGQHDVKFTALKPHVVHPESEAFKAQVDYFDRVCRVVKGMRGMVIGAIGARTTPFKTVRIDEIALQHHEITVETLDMATVISRINGLDTAHAPLKAKRDVLQSYTTWSGVPDAAFENLARLSVVLDEIIDEYQMDAMGIRCWLELQEQLGISPCVAVGMLNNQGIGTACEVDIGSAIAMHALHLVSGEPAVCLDWNNNYADEDEKCILFHCGSVPTKLMTDAGRITDHDILINAVGEGHSFGCQVGRIAQFPFTFGNLLTDRGTLKWYLGDGRFTDDAIPPVFFGCAGVAAVPQLEDVLLHVMRSGHRHHVNLTPGVYVDALSEALGYYLGHDVTVSQHV